MKDSLGDRMKANYESRAKRELIRRMPVIVRVDGKAFHTFTRGMPAFDSRLMDAMTFAAQTVARGMQGFKVGYIQSDEASFLLTDYDTLQTDGWFGYSQSKIETISASVMTAAFNRAICCERDAHFDGRAFNLPREEVCNYFLWRAKDWERNSVAMYCGSFFSHRQMHGQGRADQHEMLHGIEKNWTTDLDDRSRNGTWVFADGTSRSDILPAYAVISEVIERFVYPPLIDAVEPF